MGALTAGTLAIRAGHLFDGRKALGPGMVLVAGGRILDVDTTGAGPPAGAIVYDLGADAFLMPGLIDIHVHLALGGGPDAVATLRATDDHDLLATMRTSAAQNLRAGVTTVRDLGDRAYLSVALREELAAGDSPGPEIVAAGPPITVTGGHFHFLGGEAEGPDALRAAVRERAERGCQVVKVMASGGNMTAGSRAHESQYGLDDLRLIVEEAHRLGLMAAAHVHGPTSIADALEAGFDTLEHVTFFTADGVEANPATMDSIVKSQVVVSATLGTAPGQGSPPPEMARRMPEIRRNLSWLVRAGARVVVGSDAGIGPLKPHGVLPHGVWMLTELGMTNADALRAATIDAAAACGLANLKGRLAPGYDADLLAVRGNPIADIRALHDVRDVFRAGTRLVAASGGHRRPDRLRRWRGTGIARPR